MALDHAILVSLAEKSASGYDLARRFDASIGHFWPASHQQIYKTLGRMEGDKWVESNLVAQDGRPDKKVYSITGEGRAELRTWLGSRGKPETMRSEFALKLRALHLADREALLSEVRARRERHASTLAVYEASEAKFYPNPAGLSDDEVGPWLALRGGIRVERGGVEWCDEILQALGGGE
jgi:DNA-binding PadR family transcriptional regulator